MPIFSYVSINEKGKEIKGSIEADDQRSAVSLLRDQSLFVVSMNDRHTKLQGTDPEELQAKGWLTTLKKFIPVTSQDRVFFFQQIAMMIRSGLTLLRALDVSRQQTGKIVLSKAIGRMKRSIQLGSSFSNAVAQEGKMFPPIVQKLVYSAEISGQMDKILDQIALYLTRKAEQRRQLLTSLTYPAIVVLITIGIAGFLVVTVIPKFVQFLSRKALALPWSTQLLVSISNFVRGNMAIILILIFIMAIALYFTYQTKKGRLTMDRLSLKVPVVGKILTVSAMAQMTQTLSILLRSGITLFESLRTTAGVVRNKAINQCLGQASDNIMAGKDLATSLVNPELPPLVPQVISVGEKSGTLVQVLEEISAFYDNQLQAKTKQLATLLEPALILIIGGMVGFVYLSFFQAVFKLTGG